MWPVMSTGDSGWAGGSVRTAGVPAGLRSCRLEAGAMVPDGGNSAQAQRPRLSGRDRLCPAVSPSVSCSSQTPPLLSALPFCISRSQSLNPPGQKQGARADTKHLCLASRMLQPLPLEGLLVLRAEESTDGQAGTHPSQGRFQALCRSRARMNFKVTVDTAGH